MTNMTVANKIKQIRKARKLSQEAFAEPLHISGSYISAIEAGKKVPGDGLLDMILLKYHVSVDWWETGLGEIFAPENKKPQEDDRLRLAFSIFEKAFNAEETEEGRNALTSEMFAMLSKKRKD